MMLKLLSADIPYSKQRQINIKTIGPQFKEMSYIATEQKKTTNKINLIGSCTLL